MWYTFASQRQVVRAPGFCGGRLLIDARRTFWTLTGWEDERAMKSFRGAGSHARVMPRLFHWCDEAAYAHWTVPDGEIPDWLQAHQHLCSEGQLSRVAHPSDDHRERFVPKPRLQPLIGQDVNPISAKKVAA